PYPMIHIPYVPTPMHLPALTSPTFTSLFFSSRTRNTICLSDWSSDVCSSDLADPHGRLRGRPGTSGRAGGRVDPRSPGPRRSGEIGRASCRERGFCCVRSGLVWCCVIGVRVDYDHMTCQECIFVSGRMCCVQP